MGLLEPLLLRRLRSEVPGSIQLPHVPTIEVSLPVELSQEQQDCYRTVLARFYEVLADPRPPRHAGHRAAQMRTACSELRKVSSRLPHFICALYAWGGERSGCSADLALGMRMHKL